MEVSKELKQIRSILGRGDSSVVVVQSPTAQLHHSKAENKLLLLVVVVVLQNMSQLVVTDFVSVLVAKYELFCFFLNSNQIIKAEVNFLITTFR